MYYTEAGRNAGSLIRKNGGACWLLASNQKKTDKNLPAQSEALTDNTVEDISRKPKSCRRPWRTLTGRCGKLPTTDAILWKRIRLGSSLRSDLKKKKGGLQTKTRPYYSRGLSDMPANALWPRQGHHVRNYPDWRMRWVYWGLIGYPRQAITYNEKCKPKHEIWFPSIQPRLYIGEHDSYKAWHDRPISTPSSLLTPKNERSSSWSSTREIQSN